MQVASDVGRLTVEEIAELVRTLTDSRIRTDPRALETSSSVPPRRTLLCITGQESMAGNLCSPKP